MPHYLESEYEFTNMASPTNVPLVPINPNWRWKKTEKEFRNFKGTWWPQTALHKYSQKYRILQY